jgi:hypothetical protein
MNLGLVWKNILDVISIGLNVNININKDLKMDEEFSKLKIEFAPGAFDDFEGTQEELDELIAEIHRMVKTGEFLENSQPIDEIDEDDQEVIARIVDVEPRNLQ